ncbi:MAG: hypothetical protein N2749_05730 [Clostridia bacterium]|nr:hypothetical protein [Clostridia bacterium]
MNSVGKKRANIEIIVIFLSFFMCIVILTMSYLLYVCINKVVYPIKQDIFYIVQNAFLSLNREDLEYSKYSVNEQLLTQKITELLKLNYPKYDINTQKIKYNYNTNVVEIEIKFKLNTPVIIKNKSIFYISIKDSVKLKNMEVR